MLAWICLKDVEVVVFYLHECLWGLLTDVLIGSFVKRVCRGFAGLQRSWVDLHENFLSREELDCFKLFAIQGIVLKGCIQHRISSLVFFLVYLARPRHCLQYDVYRTLIVARWSQWRHSLLGLRLLDWFHLLLIYRLGIEFHSLMGDSKLRQAFWLS